MEIKKNDIKEVKIYMDVETKEWLQKLAKEKNKPLRTFIVDSLVQMHDTAYLEKELLRIKRETAEILKNINNIKVK